MSDLKTLKSKLDELKEKKENLERNIKFIELKIERKKLSEPQPKTK